MQFIQTAHRCRKRNKVFSKSTTNNLGYKFLKFIDNNEGIATQDTIRKNVLGFTRPAYLSSLFSDLVHAGYCKATKRNGYYITLLGKIKLKEVESKNV